MPTYSYSCNECGHVFDLFHSILDDSGKLCPECGAATKRMIGAGVGLIFKGSGFYVTDYKNRSGANDSGAGKSGTPAKPAGKSADSKAGSKSESEKVKADSVAKSGS